MTSPLGVVHVHSVYSHDGRDSLAELRSFAIARGLGFIGLTDHAEDFDAVIFARFQDECRRLSDETVTLIPGLEYRFAGWKGLHLLALGLGRWIDPKTPAEFMQEAPPAARLTIAAHPILYRHDPPPEVRAGIDAIEIWNAAYNTRLLPDPRAIRLYRDIRRSRPEVVAIAGLDQHDSRNDRQIRVRLHGGERDPLEALRAGRFTNIGRTMRIGSDVDWSAAQFAGLAVVRSVFDRVEFVQDRTARALQRWQRRRDAQERDRMRDR